MAESVKLEDLQKLLAEAADSKKKKPNPTDAEDQKDQGADEDTEDKGKGGSVVSSISQKNVNATSKTLNEDNKLEATLKENEKLKAALNLAKKAIDEHKKIAETQKSEAQKLGARMAAIEMERRTEKIADVIKSAYKDEDLSKSLETFAKSSLPVEEIESLVKPLIANNQAAAEAATESKIQEEAEKKAVVLADAALKQASTNKKHEPKVAIKNAAVEEEKEVNEIPAWARVTGGIA